MILTEMDERARALNRQPIQQGGRRDTRDPLYTREQFERPKTHDDLWNATRKKLRLCRKIHGYCRMFWGKKIVEWPAGAGDALAIMRYLHDRPWPQRPICGTIRSMGRSGMERETNVDAYMRKIGRLERTGKEWTR
jgi:deoxyribodipyrimidine photo-lyase